MEGLGAAFPRLAVVRAGETEHGCCEREEGPIAGPRCWKGRSWGTVKGKRWGHHRPEVRFFLG